MSTLTSNRSASRQPMLGGAMRWFNKLVLPLAGTRLMPLYGVLFHRGRRSGTTYRTPVVVRPTPDGFVIPMPWGLGTDWYRNVDAAGTCQVRWKGHDYTLVEPHVMDIDSASAYFSGSQRGAMARFGTKNVLHLRARRD